MVTTEQVTSATGKVLRIEFTVEQRSVNNFRITSALVDDQRIQELRQAFEEEFGIEIPDDEAEKINTVQTAIDYIEEHK